MLRSVTTRRFSRARLPIAALAVALLASGCSLLGGDEGTDAATGGTGGVEKAKIKVGVLPVVDVAPFYRAIEQGYFKEQGIEVEPVVMASGPASTAGLISGELDIAFASYPAPMRAQSQKVAEFKIVADALSAKPGHLVLVSHKGSPIKTPADIAGKRIAITGKNSFSDLAPMSVMKNQGIDHKTIDWKEMPFPDMIGAMQRGDVDGAVLVEPWVTKAMKQMGATPILDGATGPTAEIPMSGYFAIGGNGKFGATSPNTIAAFKRGLAKAHAEATDRSKMEPMFVKYAKIDAPTAQLVTISTYSTSLEANRIQRVANLMAEFGVISGPLDVKTMIIADTASK